MFLDERTGYALQTKDERNVILGGFKAIGFVMLLLSLLFIVSCADLGDRDNPLDPGANNYVETKEPDENSSSSKSIQSSSSSKKTEVSSSSKDSKPVEVSSSSKKSESSSSVNQSSSEKSSESRSSSSSNKVNSSSSVTQISSGNTSSSSSKKIESSSSKTASSSSTNALSSSSDKQESILGYCSVAIADSVGLVGSTYYICKSGKWEEASVIEYDTYKWSAGEDGEIRKGNVTDSIYVFFKYDDYVTKKNNVWRLADSIERVLGGCVNREVYTSSNSHYTSDSLGIVNREYYICGDPLAVCNTMLLQDGSEPKLSNGKDWSAIYDEECNSLYVDGKWVDNSSVYRWRHATSVLYDTYKLCSESHKIISGKVNSKREYMCLGRVALSTGGVYAALYDRSYDSEVVIIPFEDDRNGKEYRTIKYRLRKYDENSYTYQDVEQTWMIDNLDYVPPDMPANAMSCYRDSCDKYGRLYTWAAVIDSVYWLNQGKSCGDTQEMCDLPNQVQGICPNGWHVPNRSEWNALGEKLRNSFSASALNMWWFNTGWMWSSSEYSGDAAWYTEGIDSNFPFWDINTTSGKSERMKVRCVKDEE